MQKISGCFLLVFILFSGCQETDKNTINFQVASDPTVAYAASKLKEALQLNNMAVSENGFKVSTRIVADLPAESYRLEQEENGILITGGDSRALMYALLDVKDQVENGFKLNELQEQIFTPATSLRAIKFNLPWDSYRRSPALQIHWETCRDLEFWEQFLDMMVENRFNVLTLWNLHPFSWMVKPVNFPEAMSFPESELAEWQEFWHGLFGMAAERGIETYLVNWNIFVSENFARAHDAATYSIEHKYFSDGDTSALVQQYNREVVAQVLQEYPELTGLGISLGEGMGGMTPTEREVWGLETIIEGMRNAGRPVKLIHRVPFSANKGSGGSTDLQTEVMTRQTLDTLGGNIDSPVWVEIKFNWSHAHSTPELVKVHGGPIDDTYWNPQPQNYQIAWMMRNEDFFCLRWGQTDFVREHLRQNLTEYASGYFVGSECYIPAVDYFTPDSVEAPWKYAFERQWLFYKTWGRLLYDPNTDDEFFTDAFEQKYGEQGRKLFEAVNLAGKTPLRIASFWNATWDFTLYSEGFMALQKGKVNLIDLDELINVDPLEPSWLSVKEFVDTIQSADAVISPLMLADSLQLDGERMWSLAEANDKGENIAFQYELIDVKAWSLMSRYFSEKLKAAVALYRFRKTGQANWKTEARSAMERAIGHWEQLAELTRPAYREMPLVHLSTQEDQVFHWAKLLEQVREEMKLVE